MASINPMLQITRVIMAVAFAGAASLAGVTSAAAAAHPQENRITQENCESQDGAYSFERGVRTCVSTAVSVANDWKLRGAVSMYDPGTRTYFNAKYRVLTETTTVTTASQRGNQTPVVMTETSVDDSYTMSLCYRIDNNGTPDEALATVAFSECEQRDMTWAGTREKVESDG